KASNMTGSAFYSSTPSNSSNHKFAISKHGSELASARPSYIGSNSPFSKTRLSILSNWCVLTTRKRGYASSKAKLNERTCRRGPPRRFGSVRHRGGHRAPPVQVRDLIAVHLERFNDEALFTTSRKLDRNNLRYSWGAHDWRSRGSCSAAGR